MKQAITLVDCHYKRPGFAAAFIREEGDELAIIEANTHLARPLILAALEARGRRSEEVRYVIVTHAHLDHAGGAHSLMAVCPNATLIAHPRAARHLIDPEKLERSARQVYGDEAFTRLYGELRPLPAERVRALEDGEAIPFASGELRAMHTRGHAKHHMCLLDPQADAIYTGDAFGLAFPDLQHRGLFIFPSTSPTDFEGEEALASVDRIAGCGAGRAILTHFGELRDFEAARIQLRRHLTFSIEIAEEAVKLAPESRRDYLLGRLNEHFAAELTLTSDPFLEHDIMLNADGLAWSIRDKAAD